VGAVLLGWLVIYVLISHRRKQRQAAGSSFVLVEGFVFSKKEKGGKRELSKENKKPE
jgi:hypothetical protein